DTRRALTSVAITTLCGGVAATFLLWGIFLALGGHGFFFDRNVTFAFHFYAAGENPWNPWTFDPHWYFKAPWLIFPFLAFCSAAVLAISSFSSRVRIQEFHKRMAWFYLCCCAGTIFLSIPPQGVLGYSMYASILLPGGFIVLGVTLLRTPEATQTWLFYPAIAI